MSLWSNRLEISVCFITRHNSLKTRDSLEVCKFPFISFPWKFITCFYFLILSHSTSTPDLTVPAGAHTDFGGITFNLQQPGTSGLQVFYPPTGEWTPVPVTENSFVVNIGDLLHLWTGGYYRSAVHRVINKGDKHRYSAPFFYNGNMKLSFTPLDGSGGETTVEQHFRGKLLASLKGGKWGRRRGEVGRGREGDLWKNEDIYACNVFRYIYQIYIWSKKSSFQSNWMQFGQ